jgi:integrase/recombinase XerD
LTITTTSTAIVPFGPVFGDPKRLALGGFLAGYSGLTRDAYELDLRQYVAWCDAHDLDLFQAGRSDIQELARELERRGRAWATVARRLCTVASFYRYAEEEGLLAHSPAAHVRRPRITAALDVPRGRSGHLRLSPTLKTSMSIEGPAPSSPLMDRALSVGRVP